MATNFAWSHEKDRILKAQRKVSFNDAANAIREGRVVDLLPHHNQERYPGQEIYYVQIRGYIYMVPFVKEEDGTEFLKTVIPSGKATRRYLGRRT